MALLVKPNEIQEKLTYAGLIYGQPGIGKTTLALSAKNPVCIDTDKGMSRVEKRFQVPCLPVDNYGQILELLNSDELAPFDTIVIDTLGKLIDRIGDYVCNQNPKFRQGDGTLAMKGWGAVKIQFQNLLKMIQGKGKSVIFVAHEKEEKNASGDGVKKRPDVAGSSGKDIVKELDWMGYMEARGGKRTICFTPSEEYYAKNSAGLDSVMIIPDTTHGNDFVKTELDGAIVKRRQNDAETLEMYEGLKTAIDNKISACKSADDFNAVKDELDGMQEIWDSRFYWRSELAKAVKEKGIVFDKEAGKFVNPAKSTKAEKTAAKNEAE